MVNTERTGALLVNTGSPSAPEAPAVKAYLSQYLMDPNIRPMPAPFWWLILHLFILPKRQHASAAKYRQIWTDEGSPLVSGARHLAEKTESELRARLGDAAPLVRSAMSYGEPSVEAALDELRSAGCTRVIAIPLYPQTAFSTTDAVANGLSRALSAMGWAPKLEVVRGYADDPAYLDAIAGQLRDAGVDPVRDRVMFSFHSVPQPDVAAGDTYPEQAEASCREIARRAGLEDGRWTVSYHSPFEDSRTWHGPFSLGSVSDIAARTEGDLFFICPGFSIDCLESLYDVEHDFRPRAEAAFAGEGHAFRYIPCLNDSAPHARLMAGIIERRL